MPGTPEAIAEASVKTLLAHPEQVPQKFKNADGTVNVDTLTASYLELEKMKSGVAAGESLSPDPTTVAAQSAEAPIQTGTPEAAASLAEALDGPPAPTADKLWEQVGEEFDRTGTLSEGTIKGMLDAGVPQPMIQAAVDGRKVKQANDMAKAATMVGGQEELDATMAWARENLGEAEKISVVQALRGPQAETILMGLHQRRLNAAPAASGQIDTNMLPGGTLPPGDPNTNLKPFTSWLEQQAAMSDVRYKTDPEYREIVEARLILGAGQFSIAK